MNPLIQSKNATILPVLIALALGCFGLAPTALAVCQNGCLEGSNTVLGDDALISNTEGNFNTAIGASALGSNTTGFDNTAIGTSTLPSNTTGNFNTAIGISVLLHNTKGSFNTATGNSALNSNTTGRENTANGNQALVINVTGDSNTAIGASALAIATGNNNTALGARAGNLLNTGDDNIYIGNEGVSSESGAIRIGTSPRHMHTSIAGIYGVPLAQGVGVIVHPNGRLGTVVSSERFKDKIQPMDKASEAILALKPVSFHYKQEIDPEGIPQFGLVAEQVEKVNPDLVARDDQGKPYTVRYEAVNAMLLNEFLKEHRRGLEQDRKIEQLEAAVTQLKSLLATQAAQIQNVSAQLAASEPAARLVTNQ
jgi:hypothetical protein